MICAACKAEVRFGWRGGAPGWWHREDVDHPGQPAVAPEVVDVEPIPAPEITSTDLADGDERIPGGCKQIVNLAVKSGWERRRLTYARGPYVGGKGEVLSISDSIVLGVRGPQVASARRFAVASWRDGKFDFGYIGSTDQPRATKASSKEIKAWIKGDE